MDWRLGESTKGHGEYSILNNTLVQRDSMCPDGYYLRINDVCMKLVLMKPSDTSKFLNKTDILHFQEELCPTESKQLFIRKTIDKNFKYYPMYDILNEFFAEGADVIVDQHKYTDKSYAWLPNEYYPVYMPCFRLHEKVPVSGPGGRISEFTCRDGSFTADGQVCDGFSDCRWAEDEINCSICSSDSPDICQYSCAFPNCACGMFYYQCESGGCVPYDKVCDSFVDCPNGDDDEAMCYNKRVFPYYDAAFIKSSSVIGLCNPPSGESLMCKSKLQCYNTSTMCHYEHTGGVLMYCPDATHLGTGALCRYIECKRHHYKCHESYCIPIRKVCDGVIDCTVGDDEADCEAYSCPGHMRCSGATYCVSPHELCDGIAQCPHQDDEKYCQFCPLGCVCKGTAIFCDDVHTLSNIMLHSPSALILHKSFKVFLELSERYFGKLGNIYLLHLRYGSFANFIEGNAHHAVPCRSVKILYLNHQGFHSLGQNFVNCSSVHYLNLSHNRIESVHQSAFSLLVKVKILSLAFNKLQTIEQHFFEDLVLLRYLYINDNPLINIAAASFVHSPDLFVIQSDWYMVCCVATGVQDCQPQNQFVSSCSNLISSLFHRVLIFIEGISIILGNLASLIVQFALENRNKMEKFCIVNLTIADLLMGLYLIALSSVDLAYNTMFYKIVSEWTSGIPCSVLGFVNFVSSEVSLITLCILSCARMIGIQKVGGMNFIKSHIKAACICTWLLTVGTGLAYVVYMLTYSMKIRNNMCILLGITDQRYVSDFERAFQGVFITFNVLFLIIMTISIVGILYIVTKSHWSVRKVNGQRMEARNVKIIHLGFRLLLLFICNVVSWIPFLTVSMLLVFELTVHVSVLQWVVVVAVPICACADPVLYNLSIMKQYINRRVKNSK